jgi:hypothetical protein
MTVAAPANRFRSGVRRIGDRLDDSLGLSDDLHHEVDLLMRLPGTSQGCPLALAMFRQLRGGT